MKREDSLLDWVDPSVQERLRSYLHFAESSAKECLLQLLQMISLLVRIVNFLPEMKLCQLIESLQSKQVVVLMQQSGKQTFFEKILQIDVHVGSRSCPF